MSTETAIPVHPYFVGKAQAALAQAGANADADVEPLARWGEQQHAAGVRGGVGVLVDRSGRILVGTDRSGGHWEPAAWYINATPAAPADFPGVQHHELGLGMGLINHHLRKQAGPQGPCTKPEDRQFCGSGPCLMPASEVLHITAGQFTGQAV